MALDYMRIISTGVYPTPVPSEASRAASAVSQGLINFTLPAPVAGVLNILKIIGSGFKRLIG